MIFDEDIIEKTLNLLIYGYGIFLGITSDDGDPNLFIYAVKLFLNFSRLLKLQMMLEIFIL